jgi:VanZ family protein
MIGDAVLVLPVCFLVACCVEFAQLFFADRVASVDDIAAQSIGAVLGACLWGIFGQKVTDWGRLLWAGDSNLDRRLLPAYLLVLLALHLVPLNLTISPVEIYRKYKAGMVNFIPFALPSSDLFAYVQKGMLNIIYFFMLGLLLPGLPGERWRQGRQVGWVLMWGLVIATCLIGVKLIVLSRSFDVTDVLVATLSILIGWALRLDLAIRSATRGLRLVLLGIWLLLITFVTWQPFDFDFGLAEERWAKLTPIPLADLWQGSELLAFENLIQKMVLYLPFGALLTSWRTTSTIGAWVPTLVLASLIALLLEAGQLILSSRTPSLSDVYVQTAGALLGSIITRRVCVTDEARRS